MPGNNSPMPVTCSLSVGMLRLGAVGLVFALAGCSQFGQSEDTNVRTDNTVASVGEDAVNRTEAIQADVEDGQGPGGAEADEEVAPDDDGGEPDPGDAPDADGTPTQTGATPKAAGGGGDDDGDGDAAGVPPTTAVVVPGEEEPEVDPQDDPATADRVDIAAPSTGLIDLESDEERSLAAVIEGSNAPTLLWFWSAESALSSLESEALQPFVTELETRVQLVAVGTGGELRVAKDFEAQSGLGDVPNLWSSSDAVLEIYNVAQLPALVLIDSDNNIIARWPELSPEVMAFIGQLPPR